MARRPPRHGAGFTLIELLIALSIMALMALLSWRGLDGMLRTQELTRAHDNQVLALQAGLDQWQVDLESLVEMSNITALDWDGRVLRMTRRGQASRPESTLVVAWTLRNAGNDGQWLRWQSPPLATLGDWQNAWQQAALWGQNPDEASRQREVAIAAATDWQIFYYRQNAWTNPFSSDASTATATATSTASTASTSTGTTASTGSSSSTGTAAAPVSTATTASTTSTLPDGVRLVINLAPGQAASGRITRDWARPILGGGKS